MIFKMKVDALVCGTIVYMCLSGLCAVEVHFGNYGMAIFGFMSSIYLLAAMYFLLSTKANNE